jgi:hypothetical protein
VLVDSIVIDCGVKAAPRTITCFVGRLDNLTTAEVLISYPSNADGVKRVKCAKLIPKDGRRFYSAVFRVSCDFGSKDLFYEHVYSPKGKKMRFYYETLWPAGAALN